MTSEGGDDPLGHQIQPHLPIPENATDPSPVLSEEGVSVGIHPQADRSTWVQFDDNGEGKSPAQSAKGPETPGVTNQPANGSTSQTSASGHSSVPPVQSSETSSSEPQVVYNTQSEQAEVRVPAVSSTSDTMAPQPVIVTGAMIYERDRENERPLTAKRMKILKILSVLMAIVFFPTGLPAAYYAWRTPREFEEGIQRGNIDRAQKFATRAERLIIMSIIAAVLVTVLVIAIVERARTGPHLDHQYIAAG